MHSHEWFKLLAGVMLLTLISGCSTPSGFTGRSPSSANSRTVRLAQVGYVFESQGQSAKAISSYERALAMDPSNELLKERIAALRNKVNIRPHQPRAMTVADVFRDDMRKGVQSEKTNPVMADRNKLYTVSSQNVTQTHARPQSPACNDLPQANSEPTTPPSSGNSITIVEPPLWPMLKDDRSLQHESPPPAFRPAVPTISSSVSSLPQIVPRSNY